MAELNVPTAYWWKEPKEQIHEAVFGRIKFLNTQQGYSTKNNVDYMRLYSNVDILGLTTDVYTRVNRKDRITLNIIASIIDTLTAKIAKHKPRPMFLTEGGDFAMQLKAKKLQKFTDGIFYATNLYEKGPVIFRDGGIWGTGALKIFEENDEIKAERVFIDEIKVDEAEGMYGQPRNLGQLKPVPRETMLSSFPDFADKIKNAPRAQTQYSNIINTADHIWAAEMWHLASGDKTKDGRHVICIENATILDEKYEKSYFPFVFFKNNERPLGFFGQGVAERCTGLQIEINKILRTIQLSMHLCSVPKVFVENGSKVSIPQLNNEIGGVIKYTGIKPSYEPLQAVSPELFTQVDRLVKAAYEQEGVSMLSSRSEKPAGLNSGKALREYSDIETERFSILAMRYEQFFLECAERFIDIAKDIYKRNKSFSVTVKDKSFLEIIDWKDVDLERDQYIMQIFPTSMLSKTPAGRLQDVQEMIQAGFIGKEVAVKLLDFPDLEGVNNLMTAGFDDVQNAVDRMIEKGEYSAPEPYQNLKLLIELTQSAYLRARVNQVPEERLELLRRYMEEAQSMMMPPAPPLGAPSPAIPPQAKPAMPPVSDMLPFPQPQQGAPMPPMV